MGLALLERGRKGEEGREKERVGGERALYSGFHVLHHFIHQEDPNLQARKCSPNVP